MNQPVLILYLEDNPRDAELVRDKLQQSRIGCELRVARDRAEYEVALAQTRFDLILSDYNLPDFDGMAALALARAEQPDVPFIMVSGTLGDEQAVDCVLRGATDYVLKQRLDRLVPAVLRALTEGEERRKRREAEEQSRSARAFLDSVINTIADPVFVKDNTRRFVLVNDALCAIVGRPREGLLGEDGDDMFPKDQVAIFRQMDAEVLDTGEENANEETLSDLSSGEVHTIITRKTRYVDPAGERFLVGVIRDITERKKLEEQLRHSQKMEAVGQLAGGVAHDFNNLLQAMLSLTQMLVGHLSDPERLKTDAAELEQQVRRGAALTRQLLLFSRRETVRSERLDLNEVVRDGLTLLRRLLKAHVAIKAPLAEGQLPVEADRGQIGQVLINLAVNAGDAMPDGGRLAIATGSENGAVWLKVTDTGGGIPAAIREHVFEPFFTTKGLGKGTGLGLSVVHGIVTQHGGTVTFECQEGQGTTFTVTLPRAGSGEHPAVEIAERGGVSPRGHGELVLVVEDEESARQALAELLAILGYTVTAVGSGEEAGRLAPEMPFDVLLTDLMLPGISGSDLAIGLQARWPDLRVVLMSGYIDDEAIRIASGTGVVRFLQKPFDMDTLARELRAALDSSP